MAIYALYIHIPFCKAKCAYCDFDSRALCGSDQEAQRSLDSYVDKAIERLRLFGDRGLLREVRTVYIGGGTPSVLGLRLAELAAVVGAYCNPCEFSCEANPDSFTDEVANALRSAGVTRISLGVQSFNDDELRAIGRIHDAAQAKMALARAKRAGFDVSCDLMCGLPGQTAQSWEHTLNEAIAQGTDHVSVYPLTIEEGTPLAQRVLADPSLEPDEDFQADCMERAAELFRAAGFERYEVASYAKPGKACQHNIAYWTGKEYLGIGRSAASMFDAAVFDEELFEGSEGLFDVAEANSNKISVSPYAQGRLRVVQEDDGATHFDFETLSAREAAAEDLMLACRTTAGIRSELIERASAHIPLKNILDSCRRATELGLARWEGANTGTEAFTGDSVPCAHLVPTERGWLLGNVLFELFWELA